VKIVAYCMGGLMIVQGLAAQQPLRVGGLVTLASPFDWRHLGSTIDAVREGKIKPEDMLDHTGNVPGPVLVQGFKRLKPTSDLVNYANLWQNLWSDRYVEGYQAIGRFLTSHGPMPGGVLRQVVKQWMVDNGFVTDRLRFNGRRVSLANVRVPVLGVVAEKDDIAPPESTMPMVEALPNADVEILRVDAGHVSLFAGRQAVTVVMPQFRILISAGGLTPDWSPDPLKQTIVLSRRREQWADSKARSRSSPARRRAWARRTRAAS